jgi:hypothetical protein
MTPVDIHDRSGRHAINGRIRNKNSGKNRFLLRASDRFPEGAHGDLPRSGHGVCHTTRTRRAPFAVLRRNRRAVVHASCLAHTSPCEPSTGRRVDGSGVIRKTTITTKQIARRMDNQQRGPARFRSPDRVTSGGGCGSPPCGKGHGLATRDKKN